jgi:hypothetical protein
MFDDKKATISIEFLIFMVIGIILLALIIGIASKKTTDASDEFGNLLNIYTSNCDADGDGLNTTADVCPCDHDDLFSTRTYRLAEYPSCTVGRMCAADTTKFTTKFSSCPAPQQADGGVVAESDKFSYYVATKQTGCKLTSEGLKISSDAVCSGQLKKISNIDIFVLNNDCAEKAIAINTVTKAPSFVCKTSTSACKKILKKEC